VIRTHYPLTREIGMRITRENAWTQRGDGVRVVVPRFLEEIIEETSRLARTSPHVNQASGVSVRMSVANYENLVSNAERRAVVQGDSVAVARISDLTQIAPSARGKIELSMTEDTGDEDRLIERLAEEAVKNVFDQVTNTKQFQNVVEHFESGKKLTIRTESTAQEVVAAADAIRGLPKQLETLADQLAPAFANGDTAVGIRAALLEFVLEGLYVHNRLNKKRTGDGAAYGM
jgi:magnesium chelatase subunit I